MIFVRDLQDVYRRRLKDIASHHIKHNKSTSGEMEFLGPTKLTGSRAERE